MALSRGQLIRLYLGHYGPEWVQSFGLFSVCSVARVLSDGTIRAILNYLGTRAAGAGVEWQKRPQPFRARMCEHMVNGKCMRPGGNCYFAHTEPELHKWKALFAPTKQVLYMARPGLPGCGVGEFCWLPWWQQRWRMAWARCTVLGQGSDRYYIPKRADLGVL
jgi:hypothetical protein